MLWTSTPSGKYSSMVSRRSPTPPIATVLPTAPTLKIWQVIVPSLDLSKISLSWCTVRVVQARPIHGHWKLPGSSYKIIYRGRLVLRWIQQRRPTRRPLLRRLQQRRPILDQLLVRLSEPSHIDFCWCLVASCLQQWYQFYAFKFL